MRTATLLLAALGPVPFFLPATVAQSTPPSRDILRQIEAERKVTLRSLNTAMRDRISEHAIHQMRVLMRLYADDKGAQEVSRELIRVLEARFPCDGPKLRALEHLKELGEPGIQELERAALSRLRNQPVPFQLRIIATLVEANRPESYDTMLRLGRDKNPIIAVAAVTSLPAWKNLPPENRRDLCQKVLVLMRPPTPKEIENDLELPPYQRALRDVLVEFTGQRFHTIPDWQKHLTVWVREGCPAPPCEKECPAKGKEGGDLAEKKDPPKPPGQKEEGGPAEAGPQAQTVKSRSNPSSRNQSRTPNRD